MRRDRPNFRLPLLAAMACFAPFAMGQDVSSKANLQEPAEVAAVRAAEERALQISVATTDGLETLRRDVLATPFDTERTIDQMVRRLDGGLALSKAVQSADQLGSPRWREDRVCEVRLVLPGSAVADALEWAATQKHVAGKGGSAEALKAGLARLRKRTFTATGTARPAGGLERVRPDLAAAGWQQVPEADRARAVQAARQNAVTTVMDSVASVQLGGGKTLRDALLVPEVAEPVRQWLGARPVSDVEFAHDLKVRVILAAPADDLWPVVKAALIKNRFGPPVEDGLAWEKIRSELGRAVPAAEGRGALSLAAATQPAKPVSLPNIPMDAPAWSARQLQAVASVDEPGLKGARRAQGEALTEIRRTIDELTLLGAQTVGEAAKVDPRIERAINDAVQRAKVANVIYRPTGVEVRVVLELELLWRSLSRLE